MKDRAGSSPPTSSTTTWICGSSRTFWASEVNESRDRSRPSRGRMRSRSATRAKTRRQPERSSSRPRWASRSLATPAPTVPRPSRPMRTSLTSVTEVFETAKRLADSLLVLDQREADVALAVLAEADPRRDRDLGLLDQQLGELERADAAEGLRDRCPHEHGGPGHRNGPAELVEPVDEDVPALAMHLHDLVHGRLVPFQGHDPGDLDGLEGAVVEVGLDPGQGVDHAGIAAHEGQPPARHVVRLGGREDLDADLLGDGGGQER